jgi:hypothetical protein
LRSRVKSRISGVAVILVALFLAATVYLFRVSKGKWCDAVVDVGSEWIYADTLARGGLLYRDVIYWFGPFTPYFDASFFAIFGSSFSTLVIAGIAGSIGTLFALWWSLRRVTGRFESVAWAAFAVPALVFMPYSGGSILSMGHRMWHAATFSLLAVATSVGRSPRAKLARPLLSGGLCGLAALCRTEWGLATLGVILIGYLVGRSERQIPNASVAGLSSIAVWGIGVAPFVALAGPRAVFEESRLLIFGLPQETRHFLFRYSGLTDLRGGLASLSYSVGLWLSLFVLVDVLFSPSQLRQRQTRVFLGVSFLFLVIGWAAGASLGAVLFSGAPLLCLAALAVGLRSSPRRARAVASFAALGFLFSLRRPIDIRDGGYVAPPLLFAVVAAAALLQVAVLARRKGKERASLRRGLRFALVLGVGCLFLLRAAYYREDPRVPIPGTAGFLTARVPFVSRIEAVVSAVRKHTRADCGLVVIPEGALLNYLADRVNPIRHKLLIPGYLTDENEREVLAELQRAQPAAVVIWGGVEGLYGKRAFGEDWGTKIARWIRLNYEQLPLEETERGPSEEIYLGILRRPISPSVGVR